MRLGEQEFPVRVGNGVVIDSDVPNRRVAADAACRASGRCLP